MTKEKLITTKEAGEILGVTSATIVEWIKSGDLEGVKLGHRTVRTTVEAVERYIEKKKEQTQPATAKRSPVVGSANKAAPGVRKMLEAM